MKFLCDRCKTRYSIGDDRVRGKILKIRCKNCANVITVREGMDAGGEAESSRGRPTTNAPISEAKGAGALNAAFSAQLQKPPPALEEEWYVSIDGDQSGPFSLPEAQRWVASKPFDADLHCWSEGFDDWLPVDKVSHFRGLRTKPTPPAAPPPRPRPVPRVASAPAPAPRAREEDEEPKPLFAATMASLEKSASTTLPPISSPAIKTNGAAAAAAAAPPIPARSTGKAPAIPSVQAKSTSGAMPSLGGTPPTTGKGTGPVRAATTQGNGSPGAQALAAAFDTDSSENMTKVEAPPFGDDPLASADPFAAAIAKAEAPKPLGLDALAAESRGDDAGDDDNLDIGEVSRVVNLKDLKPPASRSRTPGQTGQLARATGPVGRVTGPVGRVTGPVGRVTGPVARISVDEHGLPVDPNAPPASELGAGESIAVPAPVAQTHRRGLIMLLGVAAVLLLGVVGAVVLMVTSSDGDTPLGLGHTSQINNDRPEDYAHPKNPGDVGPGSAATPKQIVRPRWPGTNPTPQHPTQTEEPTDPTLKHLGPEEIEAMAAKQGEGTKFCYIRAQKGVLGLEIQDMKKLSVTLTVDKTGTVTDVQLSEHQKDTFGSCLISRIKGWKFRPSPGGTFRIALAFAAG